MEQKQHRNVKRRHGVTLVLDVRDECQCLMNKVSCCFVFVSKVTEVSRISVVMCVLDQFVDGKLQLTDYLFHDSIVR